MPNDKALPDETQTAVLLNGLATAVFPPKPFGRKCTRVFESNPAGGTVSIYRGTPSTPYSVVTSNLLGQINGYDTAFRIPAGQGIYVTWNNAPSPVSQAYAKITCERD